MYSCDRCGKGMQTGMNVSHSHRRTKKTSLPNLHKSSVIRDGNKLAIRLCSKCMRRVRADEKSLATFLAAKPAPKAKTPVSTPA